MKILFVTTEHPEFQYGGLGTFSRDFVSALKEYAEVKVLYLHYPHSTPQDNGPLVDWVLRPHHVFPAHSQEARLLENADSLFAQALPIVQGFSPDIIHTNDRLAYIPFRFLKNVIYSSHLLFTNMLGTQAMNDTYFQEMKIEKTALEKAALVLVYSSFAQKRAWDGLTVRTQPVILPLGFFPEKFAPQKLPGRVRVAFFGRTDAVQKGFQEAVHAIRLLGTDFRKKHQLEFSVYGRGEIPDDFRDVVNVHTFLSGEELSKAYSRTDIVLMPSRYEPFGLVGLEAMASGCVLLYTPGLGMDEYTEHGINALPVQPQAERIAEVLTLVINNLEDYLETIGKKAAEFVKPWTWKRSAEAHYKVFQEFVRHGSKKIRNAHHGAYQKVHETLDYHKTFQQEILKEWDNLDLSLTKDTTILHGFTVPVNFSGVQKSYSLWVRDEECGLIPKLDWLPFNDGAFSEIVVLLAWEMVLNPRQAFGELSRVAKNTITLLIWNGPPLPWQVTAMESDADWDTIAENLKVMRVNIEKGSSKTSNWKIVQYEKEKSYETVS